MRFLPQLPRWDGDAVREAQAKTPRLGFPRGRTQRGRVTVHGQITELLNWDFLQTGLWQPGRHSGGDPQRPPRSLGKPRRIIHQFANSCNTDARYPLLVRGQPDLRG